MSFRRLAVRATAFAVAALLSTSIAFAAKPTPTGKVNINTASVEQLSTLPGVGPKLAERIVEQRQKQSFKSVQELMTVNRLPSGLSH